MQRISFLEWIRTGQFGPVKPGISFADLVHTFGEPDWTRTWGEAMPDGNANPELPNICWYGDMQFMFYDDEPTVSLIQLDHRPGKDESLSGGDRLEIDFWPVERFVPFQTMLDAFRGENIPVTRHFPDWAEEDQIAMLVVGAGLGLVYDLRGYRRRPGPDSIYQSVRPVNFAEWEAADPPISY